MARARQGTQASETVTIKRTTDILISILLGVCSCLPVSALAVDSDGDVNIDGTVDVADILWGEQVIEGGRTLGPVQLDHADVAPLVSGFPVPDGVFNLGDQIVILRVALGFIDISYPDNQFTIGDSISEGEAADGTIGEPHHETVWSTGYDIGDSVNSFNERLETVGPDDYYENNASRDGVFNHAVSGAVMNDFASQVQGVIASASLTPSGVADMVTVFLGNNDVCAPSMADMTAPELFEMQYRAGLDALATDDSTRNARIHVSGIPAIYWLWDAKRSDFLCRVLIWPLVPCENLLDGPSDDCASSTSRNDPDNDYPGDGSNCQRRKTFHRTIRDAYNPILSDVLEEYRASGALPKASYTDIYDVQFGSEHVNGGDCFHPSADGHALLAEQEWCRTPMGSSDPQCTN